MTREEAIRILDPVTTGEAISKIEYYNGFSGRTAAVQAVSDACILAVAALREQEKRNWIPVTGMDEYIAKKQVIEWFRCYAHEDRPIRFEDLEFDIQHMIPEDVAPVRHGRWLDVQETDMYVPDLKLTATKTAETCSVCKARICFIGAKLYLFDSICPACGARMDGGEQDA